MKKKVLILASLLVACISIAATPVTDLVAKVMAIQAERMLAGPVVDTLMSEVFKTADIYDKIEFDSAYYAARDVTFSQEEVAKTMNVPGDQQWYYSARAIIVTKLKCHLHKDGNLRKAYDETFRNSFLTKVSGLSEEKKIVLRNKIKSAYATFTMLKTPAARDAFVALQKAEEEGFGYNHDLRLLSRNLPEQTLAAEIETGALTKREKMEAMDSAFCLMFEDGNLAKFAGRRAVEGGDALLDQYMQILQTMLVDIK